MDDLKPTKSSPPKNQKIFVHKDLKSCTHVFVRVDRVRKALEPPYDGPFPVKERYEKYFTLTIKNKPVNISVDRLKPAYLLMTDSIPDKTTVPCKQSDDTNLLTDVKPTVSRHGRLVKKPDEVEKLAYQLNEEAERTERPIRRLSKVMYGSTCADRQVDVTGKDRRLHGGDLFARRPVRCVPLTPAHQRRRSLWCREHRNWRDNEWGRVLFTDESRFSSSSDSHRILIWRAGSRNHPRTSLKGTGSVNGTRYCNEVLLPYVRLFRGAMGLQFLFMDDNAPCHRTVASEQLLESEDIERMDWPARSPDLNPIEHVWDFLGRRLAARTLPPVTIRELRLALQDEWAAMPQQLIDTLILSMSRRCETCLAVREIISPTKDRMFLAGLPSQGCSAFSRIALHATFSIKFLFIPLIFLLLSVAYITHVLTYWGS
ncbi:transposable element Tcb2 transposase [Trichonephila clavipes]|nr:transposable element Tcb2 transposase [Trichonephila clavipes]